LLSYEHGMSDSPNIKK